MSREFLEYSSALRRSLEIIVDCFGIFWAARPENDTKFKIDPWLEECYKTRQDLVVDDLYYNEMLTTTEDKMTNEQLDLRDVIKKKAEKHSRYYRSLYTRGNIAESGAQMAPRTAPNRTPLNLIQTTLQQAAQAKELEHVNAYNDKNRQRRVGVYRINEDSEAVETRFKSVKALREKYQKMIEGTTEEVKEEKTIVRKDTYLIPPVSGYCSSSASAGSDDEKDRSWYAAKKGHLEVRRSGSSDSAVGLTQSDEESSNANVEVADINSRWIEAYEKNGPTSYSPYSPRGSIDHINVPTKTLIEAQYFPLPAANRKFSDCPSDVVECGEKNDSRRQSCFTDDGDEQSRYRFWRTPSVVVSDYSDDVVGLTLDDIEYFRNQRKENSSPDSSLHSSCSNLNYCGSTISSLDSEYILRKPFRKGSECSSCSTFSGDEGDSDDRQQPQATIDKKERKKDRDCCRRETIMSNMRSDTPPPGGTLHFHPKSPPERQKLLMESLLAVKMEQMETNVKPFVRTDSVDSTGSMGSATSIASNVCKCDDCLLGIADLYRENTNGTPVRKKKRFALLSPHQYTA
ncbi:hypothetical protein MML48_4g00007778 [Holotrichia oblita]|uniref:Uncharacterized protein n=1 Tax=Holotrichia oblita TaxID=644536 RepID=A0ACB9TBA9_HOLOL|nr:hypothetical protein MML48_4g00007778 [Holotrichia oblita]